MSRTSGVEIDRAALAAALMVALPSSAVTALLSQTRGRTTTMIAGGQHNVGPADNWTAGIHASRRIRTAFCRPACRLQYDPAYREAGSRVRPLRHPNDPQTRRRSHREEVRPRLYPDGLPESRRRDSEPAVRGFFRVGSQGHAHFPDGHDQG